MSPETQTRLHAFVCSLGLADRLVGCKHGPYGINTFLVWLQNLPARDASPKSRGPQLTRVQSDDVANGILRARRSYSATCEAQQLRRSVHGYDHCRTMSLAFPVRGALRTLFVQTHSRFTAPAMRTMRVRNALMSSADMQQRFQIQTLVLCVYPEQFRSISECTALPWLRTLTLRPLLSAVLIIQDFRISQVISRTG